MAATRAVPTAHQPTSLGSPACSQARVPLWSSACPKGRKATTCPFMTRWRQPKQELCWPQLCQSRPRTADSELTVTNSVSGWCWLGRPSRRPQGQAPLPCPPPRGAPRLSWLLFWPQVSGKKLKQGLHLAC